jgi:hypothetical protein
LGLIGLAAYFEAFCKNQFAAIVNICPETLNNFASKRDNVALTLKDILKIFDTIHYKVGSLLALSAWPRAKVSCMSIKNLAIGILIALVTVTAFFAFMIWGLGTLLSSGCGNEGLRETPSPDGRFKAVIFQRDCGATTGFSTQVSVLPINQSLPNDYGNVFRADTDHGKAPSGPGGGPKVEVRWEGEKDLIVLYDERAKVFHRENLLKDITVRYETMAR